jgi:hypothetical protein
MSVASSASSDCKLGTFDSCTLLTILGQRGTTLCRARSGEGHVNHNGPICGRPGLRRPALQHLGAAPCLQVLGEALAALAADDLGYRDYALHVGLSAAHVVSQPGRGPAVDKIQRGNALLVHEQICLRGAAVQGLFDLVFYETRLRNVAAIRGDVQASGGEEEEGRRVAEGEGRGQRRQCEGAEQ